MSDKQESCSSSSSSGSSRTSTRWQDYLHELCKCRQFNQPQYQALSDRRGSRTAWSSRVTVNGETFEARFWYDGNNVNNAREDAAETAVQRLGGVAGGGAAMP